MSCVCVFLSQKSQKSIFVNFKRILFIQFFFLFFETKIFIKEIVTEKYKHHCFNSFFYFNPKHKTGFIGNEGRWEGLPLRK